MSLKLRNDTYIDWTVYSVTKIKEKYGFRIKLDYKDETIIQQKSGFSTKKVAEERRNIAIAELTNHTYVVYPNIKVAEFYDYWLNEVMKSKIEYNSYMSYRNAVCNYIIKEYGTLKMTTLNQAHIQKLYNHVTKEHISVAKIVKTVMNNSLDYAKTMNIVSANVATDIDLPKSVKKKEYRTLNIDSSKTYNIEQVKQLLQASKNTPIYLEVMFAVLMGMRISEINALKYTDIDYVNKKVYASTQLGKDLKLDPTTLKKKTITKQEKKMKTKNSKRWLDIPDILFNAIIEQRAIYEKNKRRRINDKHNPFVDDNYICCSTYGHSRSRGFHYDYYKEIIKQANLPYIRFHDLRHTYTTILVKANFSIKAISQLLGHANEIITVDVYTDKLEIIYDCLDALNPYIERIMPVHKEKHFIDCTQIQLNNYFSDFV